MSLLAPARLLFLTAALGAAAPSVICAPTARLDLLGDAFQGVAFGDTVEQVQRKLEGQCDELERIEVTQPYLPLASESQTHLIALGVPTAGVDEVAFVFGDDALVLVEARGGAVDGLWSVLEEEPVSFGKYAVRLQAEVVAYPERDVVWLLGPGALHAHLFLWENPDLPSAAARPEEYESSAARPPILEFGGALEDLLPRLEQACPVTTREEIAQPWLPTAPKVQTQINGYGLAYAGFPRKVEAVFGDGELQLAWILTGAGDEARLRKALTLAYGKPEFVSKNWEAFDGFRVALRKDKPEVLMIADELVPTYREQIRSDSD